MSIFSAIMDKIFHHPAAHPAAAPAALAQSTPQVASPAQAPAAEPTPSQQPVDVEAVLQAMASKAPGGGGNWQSSIVDMLKLLDLDSSLDARKQLASELGVNAGAPGTAEENVALHRAVMAKLAENGGKVPDTLKNAA